MSHFENIKRAVEFSRHRKAVCKDKFKIMSGFEAQFKKEVLKQVNQMIEANPELRKNRQIVALTSKISKSASKAAKDETIKEILYRSTMERKSILASSIPPGKEALAAPPGAMSQSYKVDNVGEILQVDDNMPFNETMDNGQRRRSTSKLSTKQAKKELERLQRRLQEATQPVATVTPSRRSSLNDRGDISPNTQQQHKAFNTLTSHDDLKSGKSSTKVDQIPMFQKRVE